MDTFADTFFRAIQGFNILIGVGVFFAYLVVDALYAHYTLAVTDARAGVAATTGALMHFLIALGVLSYVENYLYILPIAVGSWVGTYLVVRREHARRTRLRQGNV